jgi:hypothetical protein
VLRTPKQNNERGPTVKSPRTSDQRLDPKASGHGRGLPTFEAAKARVRRASCASSYAPFFSDRFRVCSAGRGNRHAGAGKKEAPGAKPSIRSRRPLGPAWAVLSGVLTLATSAAAQSPAPVAVVPAHPGKPDVSASAPLNPERYELAGFPIVGGNTDIGVQFGGAATLTRFHDGAFPYDWNIDLLLSASVKDDAGFRLVQQSHVLRLDAPNVWSGRARLDTRASYQRTIDAGYYGIGNAIPAPLSSNARRYQYLQEEPRVRNFSRLHLQHGLDLAAGADLRYEAPQVYAGSKLADDRMAAPGQTPVLGADSGLLAGIAGGIMIDTRDSEFVTRRGIFYQVGVGATVGSMDRVAYGNASCVLSHYAPLGPDLVFASRFVAAFQFGRVPFYDLAQGGTFEAQYLLGGESGIRGVPQGRYAGLVKTVANLEIRGTPFPRFELLGQRLRVGTTTFLDVGRVWAHYSVISSADGTSLNLKYGIGGGVFLQWGEAAIFRIEAAYSPDAVAENPKLPVGIYVSDGLMF